jgi:hypothetical protein
MKRNWGPRGLPRLGAVIALLALSSHAYGAPAQATPSPAPAPNAVERTTEAPEPEAPRPRQVEARADALMKEMSAFLAKQPRFALEAEETLDEVYAGAPRIQLTNVRRAAIQRPSRFASDASGDTLNRSSWYDGKTITALEKEENTYLTVEMPGTIDAVLDKLADEYGIVVPLSDILYSDPYATLMAGVVYGEYRGIHLAAGVPCHHLAFSQEDIDWQIWIDAGAQPLPRKIVITYAEEPGAPQYTAVIKRWSLDPKFTEELFHFVPPEGATSINEPAPSPATAPPASASATPHKEDK